MKKLLITAIVAVSSLAGLQTTHADTLTNGLIAYYNFNNSSTNDSSPSSNNLILNGATFTTDRFGNPNSALAVKLTNGAIQQNNVGISGKAARTISVWVNPTSIPDWNSGRIVDWGSGTYGWCNIQYCNRINKTIYLTSNNLVWDGGYSLSGVTSSPSDLSSKWHNIVMTYDGTNALFYIDGVIQSNQASTSSFSYINTVNTPLKISGYPLGINGSIDDVRIYNRALSAIEVSALYNPKPVVVYSLTGAGTASTASTNQNQNFSGYFTADDSSQQTAFIWFGGTPSAKTYTLEKRTDIDVQSTASGIGAKLLYSYASTKGTFPNVEKEMIWLSGAKALVALAGNTKITAPSQMTGILNNLTIQGGTVIENQNATLTLDKPNTLSAYTNNESLDAVITRLTNNLKTQGYSPAP